MEPLHKAIKPWKPSIALSEDKVELPKVAPKTEATMNKLAEHNLYIGGMFTLRRKEALKEANITHVISVLRLPLDKELFTNFKHLVVEVDDVDDENLIEHFDTTNKFIDDAVENGGSVLIHCAMGKSRSATILTAYLIYKNNIPPDAALALIKEVRPLAEPNTGFMEQLQLYYDNLGQAKTSLDDVPAYQRYLYRKEAALSTMAGKAPVISRYAMDVAASGPVTTGDRELRCRKCRRVLATSKAFLPHTPKMAVTSTSRTDPLDHNPATASQTSCAHYFLDPIAWMKPELEKGELEGKFECPKCRSKVGGYAWQGMKCSCGTWEVPSISLSRSRVDEIKSRPQL